MGLKRSLVAGLVLLLVAPLAEAAQNEHASKTRAAVARGMTCTPETVYPGDLLVIALPYHHGGDFAALNPSGELLFIIFVPSRTSGELAPVVPVRKFLRMRKVELEVNDVKGVSSDLAGQLIFQRSGIYSFAVSKAFETEDPILDGSCKVRFLAK